MIFTPLQKLPNNVGDLVKIIVATGFELLPKVQKIAKPGHTDLHTHEKDIFCIENHTFHYAHIGFTHSISVFVKDK